MYGWGRKIQQFILRSVTSLRRDPMSVSRRDFLHVLGSGRTGSGMAGSFIAARGLEAHLAEAQQQGRKARALTPPGTAEIRISSNENPLGPGKVALDAILGLFS